MKRIIVYWDHDCDELYCEIAENEKEFNRKMKKLVEDYKRVVVTIDEDSKCDVDLET